MTREIRIVHPDGSTDTLTHFGHAVTEEFGKVDQASVYVDRDELNGITVSKAEDEVELHIDGTKEFGGVLTEVVRGGAKPELIVASYEQYAQDAENTPAGQNYDNVDDSTIVSDAIAAVDQLTAGTVNTVQNAVSFVFSYSSQARKIRKVEEATPGEVKYNADKTVDYVDSLGADKTGTTLSPANQNVVGDFEVSRRSEEEEATHITVLGAGEGPHQISATLVPKDDSYDYEADSDYDNVVRYTNNDWNRPIWRTYTNKDVTSVDAIKSLGNTLITELQNDKLEVDGVVKGVDVDLGDEFRVTYPEEGVDDDLRVVELEWILDKDGERYSVVLSNMQKARSNPNDRVVQDVERYNMAVQGVAVPINAGGGRQPVNGTHDYEMRLYYPDEVVYEHRLNARVIGLPYRAYSQGAASGGDHTHSVSVDATSTSQTDSNVIQATGRSSTDTSVSSSSFDTITSFMPTAAGERLCVNLDQVSLDSENVTSLLYRLHDTSTGEYFPGSSSPAETIVGASLNDFASTRVDIPKNVDGHTIEVQAMADSSEETRIGWQWWVEGDHTHSVDSTETSDASGGHTHEPEPGIIESFGGNVHYPSNCDVIVNGTSMGTSFGDGSGEFNESVDIRDELVPGQINTVRVSSESLGHLQVYVEGDTYRQVLGQG